jgi:phosphomethylpyrimidine synthase
MRITKDIREFAAKEQISVEEARARGLRERAEAFRQQGGEIYQPATAGRAQRPEVTK